jgi:hypothetical protein
LAFQGHFAIALNLPEHDIKKGELREMAPFGSGSNPTGGAINILLPNPVCK